MQHLVLAAFVAVTYVVLGALSAAVAYSPADAWTVWLSSGVVLGLLLALDRARWPAILVGGFVGATAFAVSIGSGLLDAVLYGVIEVVVATAAAFVVSRLTPLPIRLQNPRELTAVILGGALPLAILGAALATFWHVVAGGNNGVNTYRLWSVSNFVGTLLVAPMLIAWAHVKVRRSGGMPMPAFIGGAVAAALFLGTLWLLFDRPVEQRFFGTVGPTLTYVPIVFMALVGLLWGVQGASLTAFLGALIAILNTAQGEGPFAGVEGLIGEAEVEVEVYALAIALTGLLIAVLAAAQRNAMRAARDWQTRFEATIGAHRLLAYEWDPVSGRFNVTGDALRLVGRAPAQLATLADWLALVAPDDRDRVAARFDARARGDADPDVLDYAMSGAGGTEVMASDEARAIRDHDGSLHRIVGIVRAGAPAEQDSE
ncbi:MAG: MASE1 domain-containing protein [Betaproteobacteria bacterium]